MGSSQPSSLAAPHLALLRQKEKDRLQSGRQSIKPPSQLEQNLALTKLYTLQLPGGEKPPPTSELPPLAGTVDPLTGAKDLHKTPLFGEDGALIERSATDSDETMTKPNQLTVRTIEGFAKPGSKSGYITMKKAEWEQVLGAIKSIKDDRTNLKQENASLTAENKKLTHANTKLSDEIEGLANQKGRKGKKGSSHVKHEQKKDVVDKIKDYVKDVLFRTVKFALPGVHLEAATKTVWEAIKDNLQLDKGPKPLTLEVFTEVYESVVLSELSNRRQYVQTRCKIAATGTKFV